MSTFKRKYLQKPAQYRSLFTRR